MESTKENTCNKNQEDLEDNESLIDRRVKNLENYNQNLANHMIYLLNSINNNILSLSGDLKDLKDISLLGGDEGKDRGKARSEDVKVTDSTFTSLDQDMEKAQDQMAEEHQKMFEAAQMMQDLEKEIEEQSSIFLSVVSFFLAFGLSFCVFCKRQFIFLAFLLAIVYGWAFGLLSTIRLVLWLGTYCLLLAQILFNSWVSGSLKTCLSYQKQLMFIQFIGMHLIVQRRIEKY